MTLEQQTAFEETMEELTALCFDDSLFEEELDFS